MCVFNQVNVFMRTRLLLPIGAPKEVTNLNEKNLMNKSDTSFKVEN